MVGNLYRFCRLNTRISWVKYLDMVGKISRHGRFQTRVQSGTLGRKPVIKICRPLYTILDELDLWKIQVRLEFLRSRIFTIIIIFTGYKSITGSYILDQSTWLTCLLCLNSRLLGQELKQKGFLTIIILHLLSDCWFLKNCIYCQFNS